MQQDIRTRGQLVCVAECWAAPLFFSMYECWMVISLFFHRGRSGVIEATTASSKGVSLGAVKIRNSQSLEISNSPSLVRWYSCYRNDCLRSPTAALGH